MTQGETLRIAGIATALLAVVVVVVWIAADDTTGGAANAAATLALIGFTAVAIERVIETGWTVFGGVLGSYWPLKQVSKQVDALVTQLNAALEPLQDDIGGAMNGVSAAANAVAASKATANAVLGQLTAQLKQLEGEPRGNQRARAISRVAARYVEQAKVIMGEAAPAIAPVQSALDALQGEVDSLTDNPGRRLISLYLGVILGIGVAYAFDLNLFHAALAGGATGEKYLILTGVVIGLGSNPTHELIRAIQEYKKSQKSSSAQPA